MMPSLLVDAADARTAARLRCDDENLCRPRKRRSNNRNSSMSPTAARPSESISTAMYMPLPRTATLAAVAALGRAAKQPATSQPPWTVIQRHIRCRVSLY